MAVLALSIVAAMLVLPGMAGAAPATGLSPWDRAQEIPGTGALNRGGGAAVQSVSCGLPGNCVAGGYYSDVPGHDYGLFQAFIADELDGRWHKAIEVPGTAALNLGHNAVVNSVSCAAPGQCAAAGSYRDGARRYQAFVVAEVHGRWRAAIEVPGTAVLHAGGSAEVDALSCPSPGSCAAGGLYDATGDNPELFVASQVGGHWRRAARIVGTWSVVDAQLSRDS